MIGPLRSYPLPMVVLESVRSKAPRTPYAHVTFPFGNPLGYHGERPLLVAPFSTELADVSFGDFSFGFIV